MAFARIKGRDALIVVAATQFGRASADGQNWPSPELWDASLNLSGFTGLHDVRTESSENLGTISQLLSVLPIAVLRGQYTGRSPFR